jgi:hypothetical protein
VSVDIGNQRIEASSARSGSPVTIRANWHPRWETTGEAGRVDVERLSDGYIGIAPAEPLSRAALVYSAQPLDWAARVLLLAGLVGLAALVVRSGWPVPGIHAGILQRRVRRNHPNVTSLEA